MSSSLDKLRAAMETASPADGGKKQSFSDDTMWKPELDKSGNGYAVVRFLPTPEGEEMPWVSYFDHGFQGPGGWYIEKSLTTLNKQDPVSEYNTQLWNTGIEANKEIARKQKRRLHYVSNVYVVSDPKNPDNEGKVFKYRFGKKIFEALKEAISPAFEDEKAINPFDLRDEGANFKIKIRKVDGYWNYDKSEFESVSALAGNDEEIKTTWSSQHALKPFLAADNFKTYEELKEKLNRVLSGARKTETVAVADLPPQQNGSVKSSTNSPVASDDDDTMSYFSKLAEDE
mgnify:CR=1 FL=1